MRLVVCMPSFNEELRVCSFLERLNKDLGEKYELHLVLIDDASTDNTSASAQKLGIDNLVISRNSSNLGHGPSTIKAILISLELDPDVILCCDGDGEVDTLSLDEMVTKLQHQQVEIVEGARHSRMDPWFRKITTFVSRLLVFQRTGNWPKDSNTPFRAYKPEAVKRLLERLPQDSLIPNLHISALTRLLELDFITIPVLVPSTERHIIGVTWNQKFKLIPSKRFLSFCAYATVEWLKAEKMQKTSISRK